MSQKVLKSCVLGLLFSSVLFSNCIRIIRFTSQQNQNTYQDMNAPESYSLLKSQTNSAQQTSTNPSELKASLQQKEAIMADYARRVEQKREEMKRLSKEVNTLIQKQLKKPTKERPSFHVSYSKPHLNALKDEKNKVFVEIEQLKQQIKALKIDYPESIVNQVSKNEARMIQLQKQIAKAEDIKSIITKTLQEYKKKIQAMKESIWQTDLQKREIELATIKKQCKQLQKEINMFAAEELTKSSFFFEIKDRFQKEIIQEKIEIQVDQHQLKSLLSEINQIYEKRKIVETDGTLKIKNQQKMILELEKSIVEKKVQIRELQNDVLRVGLTTKRMYSMVNIGGQKSKKESNDPSVQKSVNERKKAQNPEEKKAEKRIISKIYMIQKDDANCIYIGQWSNNSKPMSDKQQIPLTSVDRVKSLIFFLNDGKVVGVKSTYFDKNNSVLSGKDLTVNVPSQMKVDINIEEVTQLEYSRKSEDFYIRFFYGNGSWKELGQRGSQVEKINLEPYNIKYVEILPNNQFTFVLSLKFILEEKMAQKLGLSDVGERTSSQMSDLTFENQSKKKVVLRGRSLKRIKQQTIIDHRLMLNKQK